MRRRARGRTARRCAPARRPGCRVPRSTTRTRMRPPLARARTETGWPAPWRSAFSNRFANARSSCAASASISGRSGVDRELEPLGAGAGRLGGGAQDLLDRRPVAPRLGGPRLESGEVEELVDEQREPLALGADARGELAPVLLVERGRAERLAGREDRGQRRAQVVRHRAQHRGLDLVGAAQRARLHDLVRELLAMQRGGQQRLERRHDPPGERRARGGRHLVGRHERADLAVAVVQREHGAPSLRRLVLAEHDRHRRQPERVGDPLRRRAERGPHVRRAQQQPRELGAEVGLAPPLLGLERAAAREVGDARGRHRRDQQHDERHPVLPLGDREAPGRRDVEVVERERGADAGGEPEPDAPHGRDEQHRQQVDDAERDLRRDLAERVQEQRRDRDGATAVAMPSPLAGARARAAAGAMPLRLLPRQELDRGRRREQHRHAGARVARRVALLAQHDGRPRAAGVELPARARRRARAGRSRRARRRACTAIALASCGLPGSRMSVSGLPGASASAASASA